MMEVIVIDSSVGFFPFPVLALFLLLHASQNNWTP